MTQDEEKAIGLLITAAGAFLLRIATISIETPSGSDDWRPALKDAMDIFGHAIEKAAKPLTDAANAAKNERAEPNDYTGAAKHL